MREQLPPNGLHCRAPVAIAICTVVVFVAGQARATTTPGVRALVSVTLTNSNIAVAVDKFTSKKNPGLTRYPRGATVTFSIRNEGTKPLVLVLRAITSFQFYVGTKLGRRESTGTIDPSGGKRLHATFIFRGKYEFDLVSRGKIVARSPISVF
jgi:hypothetical protein